jgi:hypothetical protein
MYGTVIVLHTNTIIASLSLDFGRGENLFLVQSLFL